MILQPGKLNQILDGQTGSCGKGSTSLYIGLLNHIDIAVTSAASNAGHSFILNGKKYISKYIPVSGIVNRRSQILLCSGAIIDVKLLLKEIDFFEIDPNRIIIHPRCAIIEEQDILFERDVNSATTKLASTQSGVGRALARKVMREAKLAASIDELKPYVREFDLQYYLDQGCTAFMEVPQGMDLSLNSGLAYPYCTSRDISVSAALSDAQVHPSYLGKVCVVLRTYPIRVGNITDEQGNEIGNSGPFYDDSEELRWEELGVEPELTTVTGRIRRVFSFSMKQYNKMLKSMRPDYIFLNFANYMTRDQLAPLLEKLPEVTHLGFGPRIEDIFLNHGY